MSETRVQIRAESAADARQVDAVITAAFGAEGRHVAAIWDDVRSGRLWHDGIVAVEGDRVVGHVGLSHAWLDARERLVDIVVLSPLSVSPDRQRSGIGGLLLRTAVEAALRRSPIIVLEGDPGYYGARGFAAASDHGILPPSDRIPPAACQVVLGHDHEPWMTGRIVYPEVWWRHDAVGLRDPLLEQVESRG